MSEWQPLPDGTYDDFVLTEDGRKVAVFLGQELGDEMFQIEPGHALCRLVERAEPQPYSHRNGETEPPTVDGWYAMQHPQAWNWQGSTYVFVESNMDEFDVYCAGQDDPIGYHQMDSRIKWYGPIVPPWEADHE